MSATVLLPAAQSPLADLEPIDVEFDQLCVLLGVDGPRIRYLYAKRRLPPADLLLTSHTPRWRASTIRRWLAQQAQQAEATNA